MKFYGRGKQTNNINILNGSQVDSIVTPIYKHGTKSFQNLEFILALHISPTNFKFFAIFRLSLLLAFLLML